MNTSENKTAVSNGNVEKKENLQVGEVVARTEQFIDKNKKTLLICLLAIVAVVVIVCLYSFWYVPSKSKDAADAMFFAEQYYAQRDYDKALKGDGKHAGLIEIADDYKRTKQGKLASYYVGRIYLEQGKYKEALDYLKAFSPKDAYMASQAKALVGDCYMELNQLDDAVSYYKTAAKTKPNDFTTPAILMKLGAAYEMKKDYQSALDTYKSIKADYPATPEYQNIEKYISRMETLLGK
ncbi:MAG: tetratricopeptide repeat protein [Bacteroidales bacterium]|nr:tetratricopeptide repeat protein [Bacteroidales bacterium]